MSKIHGLTPSGRILRRVDRFLRCLQEELSAINASVFNTSLIELKSIKTLKLNLSAPFSPFFSSDNFILNLSSCQFTDLRHADGVCLWPPLHIFAEHPPSLHCTGCHLSSTPTLVESWQCWHAAAVLRCHWNQFWKMRHSPVLPSFQNKSLEEAQK